MILKKIFVLYIVMKYIGNILTEGKFSNNELFNVVSEKGKLISGIPTLCIGWYFTKENYPDVNIINWQIDENTYWTYGNREKRNRYEENVAKFKKLAIERLIKTVDYQFISVVTAEREDKVELNKLLLDDSTNIYANNDMMYVNGAGSNVVIGFSLKDVEFVGKSKKNIFDHINKASLSSISKAFNKISPETKIQLKNHNYVIPYLFS